MASAEDIRSLDVVLTARCNLKCGYCYQDDKNNAVMDWPTLQASIDLLLASRHDRVDLVFYGGEPLLELPSIRRAVAYVGETCPPAKTVRYTISTNGMLLDDATARFLVEHDFKTQLSFDGVPGAQSLRGAHTFARLDALLDRLGAEHPSFARNNLSVNITLTCGTIEYLADSVAYFLAKGVQAIDITPTFTDYAAWRPELWAALDAQFDRARQLSLAHYRRTGEVPVSYFRRTGPPPPPSAAGRTMCGVPRGEHLAVDVNGEVNGCVTLGGSYQTYSRRFLRERARAMSLGDLRDAAFPEKLRVLGQRARATGLFHGKQRKYSTYGRCGDCSYLQRCMVCPVSIGHLPGNDDPDRVPDFPCAFNFIALAHQDRFPAQPGVADVLTGRAPVPELVAELMQFVDRGRDGRPGGTR